MIGPSEDGRTAMGQEGNMLGDPTAVSAGLIPRSCAYILDRIASSGASTGCTIRASFLEIYQEQVP